LAPYPAKQYAVGIGRFASGVLCNAHIDTSRVHDTHVTVPPSRLNGLWVSLWNVPAVATTLTMSNRDTFNDVTSPKEA